MYIFRIEKKDELLNGRKVKWIAEKLNITPENLYLVLSGKKHCTRIFAFGILSLLGYGLDDINIYFYEEI